MANSKILAKSEEKHGIYYFIAFKDDSQKAHMGIFHSSSIDRKLLEKLDIGNFPTIQEFMREHFRMLMFGAQAPGYDKTFSDFFHKAQTFLEKQPNRLLTR